MRLLVVRYTSGTTYLYPENYDFRQTLGPEGATYRDFCFTCKFCDLNLSKIRVLHLLQYRRRNLTSSTVYCSNLLFLPITTTNSAISRSEMWGSLTAMNVNNTVSWNVTSCSLVRLVPTYRRKLLPLSSRYKCCSILKMESHLQNSKWFLPHSGHVHKD
jgi:hypothetical protein